MKIEFAPGFAESFRKCVGPWTPWERFVRFFKNGWYQLKCWGWKRYTTVRPRTIKGHGYVDPDYLMLHCMFEILCQYVEKEMCAAKIKEARDPNWAYVEHHPDWDEVTKADIRGFHEHSHGIDVEILALYDWWKNEYPKYSIQDGPYSSFTQEEVEHEKVEEMTIRLMKIRGCLWS